MLVKRRRAVKSPPCQPLNSLASSPPKSIPGTLTLPCLLIFLGSISGALYNWTSPKPYPAEVGALSEICALEVSLANVSRFDGRIDDYNASVAVSVNFIVYGLVSLSIPTR